jgi:hypothetical protein
MSIRLPLLCALLPLLAVGDSRAQDSLAVEPGARIRIHTTDIEDCQPCIGTLVSLDADQVVFMPGPRSSRTIPRSEISRLEVSIRHTTGTRRGAAIGGLIGGILGLGAGLVGGARGNVDCEGKCTSCWGPAALGIVVGGGLGAGTGGVVGSLSQSDEWQSLPLESLRVGLGIQSDCTTLSISIRF